MHFDFLQPTIPTIVHGITLIQYETGPSPEDIAIRKEHGVEIADDCPLFRVYPQSIPDRPGQNVAFLLVIQDIFDCFNGIYILTNGEKWATLQSVNVDLDAYISNLPD